MVLLVLVFGLVGFGLGRKVAGASAGKLVGVNEESSVWVTGIDREHPVVDILLGALGLVAGGKETTSGVGEETGLEAGGLGVVVMAVSVTVGDVLEDDSPVALDVDGTGDLGVIHIGWAEVSLGSDPVGGVILGGSL